MLQLPGVFPKTFSGSAPGTQFSCTTEQYDQLYRRYLTNVGQLLEMAGYETSNDLLDLCGGTGAITREALQQGATPETITLLDLKPRFDHPGIRKIRASALQGLRQLHEQDKRFDTVVCRQAFAYPTVDGDPGGELVLLLGKVVRPGGCFVFNCFVRPRWMAKRYRSNGHHFIEVAELHLLEVYPSSRKHE